MMDHKGFFDLSDGISKGKGLDAIENSRQSINSVIALFGGVENVPSSIMKGKFARPDKETDKPVVDRGLYEKSRNGEYLSKDKNLPKSLRRAYHVSGSGCGSGALSTFPQNIGRSIVLLYSNPGDTIFDPFAGHNSRMDLCVKAGRNYIGCDLSNEFMAFNFQRADKLRGMHPKQSIELHHCDSRRIPVKDGVGDMTITSPPYYDIEDYGDEPKQLGKAKTYQGFLNGLVKVLRENFRILKAGAFAAWFVNDFRRKGKLHFYHIDVIRLAESVGFVPHDIMIVDLGRGIRDCFPNQIVKSRIVPKRHEYGLIFRKPK